ncbi:hypothetical protein BDR26DRAFT_852325 [Obelidium mucronatum]|nr:hypothetical protein BDR26DRAFT_852325 [Obelidium mucronatum]
MGTSSVIESKGKESQIEEALERNHILRQETQAYLFKSDLLWRAVTQGTREEIELHSKEVRPVNGNNVMRGICERGGEGETILHAAILCRRSFEIITWIATTFEELINEPYRYCEKYYGETPLHMAVVQFGSDVGSEESLVDWLLDNGANPNGEKCTGTEFSGKGDYSYGQTPLHFAVSTGKVAAIHRLLKPVNRSKSDLQEKDNTTQSAFIEANVGDIDTYTGNNVLHMLSQNKDLDRETFKKLFDLLRNKEPRMITQKNQVGDTPIDAGIRAGNVNIIEAMKEVMWGFDERRYRIPLRKLDSLLLSEMKSMAEVEVGKNNPVSMIEIGVANNDPSIITHPVIDALLDWKWQLYAQFIYTTWFLGTFTLVGLVITPTIALQPTTFDRRRTYDFASSSADFWRAVFEVSSLIGATIFFYRGVMELYKKYQRTTFVSLLHEIADATFSFSLLCIPIIRLSNTPNGIHFENILFGLAAIVGWIHLLRFAKVSSRVGPLVIVFSTIITKDLVEWLWIYAPLTFGFAAALYLQMQNVPGQAAAAVAAAAATLADSGAAGGTSSNSVFDWDTYSGSTMWMLRFSFGQAVFDDFRKGESAFLACGLFLVYGFLVIILLINVLIGKLANTFERINEVSKKEWKMQRAPLILDIDEHLSSTTKEFYGSKIGFSEDGEERYFQFTERKNSAAAATAATTSKKKQSEIVQIIVSGEKLAEKISKWKYIEKTPHQLAEKFKWKDVFKNLIERENKKYDSWHSSEKTMC